MYRRAHAVYPEISPEARQRQRAAAITSGHLHDAGHLFDGKAAF